MRRLLVLILIVSGCATTLSHRQTGFAPVPGGRLYYETAGQGRVVVLIHAGIADCTMWDEQFDEFSQQFRIIRYDARGFGKSRTKSVSFSNRQDLADLLRHLGVSNAVIIGLSRGGNIATDFTLEHPEMVEALIVVGAGIGGFDPGPVPAAEQILFSSMETAEKMNDFARIVDLDLQAWVAGPGQPMGRAPVQVRKKVRAMDVANYTRVDGVAKPQPLQPPAIGRLNEISVPTLVIVGDLDTTDSRLAAKRLAHDIPGAKLVVFHGVAHMVNMEKPVEFNETVIGFLRSH